MAKNLKKSKKEKPTKKEAKKITSKKSFPKPAAVDLTPPAPSKFKHEIFFEEINSVTIGKGLPALSKAARKAIEKEKELVKVPPYMLLALITSYQSIIHDFQIDRQRRGKDPEKVLHSISHTGIVEKIEDEKVEMEARKAAEKAARKKQRGNRRG